MSARATSLPISPRRRLLMRVGAGWRHSAWRMTGRRRESTVAPGCAGRGQTPTSWPRACSWPTTARHRGPRMGGGRGPARVFSRIRVAHAADVTGMEGLPRGDVTYQPLTLKGVSSPPATTAVSTARMARGSDRADREYLPRAGSRDAGPGGAARWSAHVPDLVGGDPV